MKRTWTLKLRPASIALAILVVFLLGDSSLAILLGARNSTMHRQNEKIKLRLDSLSHVRESLQRRLLVQTALVEASAGRIPHNQAVRVADEIDRNAQLYHFDPLLILAVVLTESEGNTSAVGRLSSGTASGAIGVMQVQPATARQTAQRMGIVVPDSGGLLDPSFNLTVGVAYLLQMIHRYGDLRLGIMAYNVGASGLESGLRGESDLPEAYYRKVFANYRSLLAHLHAQRLPKAGGTHTAVANLNGRGFEPDPVRSIAYA